MEISYELTAKDVVSFLKYSYKTSPVVKRLRLCTYLFCFALASHSFLISPYTLFARVITFFIELAAFTFFLWCVTFVINFYVFRRSVPKGENNGVLGGHKIILTERELIETTNVNEMHNLWNGIDKVVQNESYIYIYINPQQAHIIPKRAFVDEQQAEAFYIKARTLKERAGGVGGVAEKSSRQPVPDHIPPRAPVSYLDERDRTPIERVLRQD